jgi:chaperonin GroES
MSESRYHAAGTQKARVPGSVTKSEKEGWMDLQPLGDRLIVEVLEDEETTVSGIVLPDTAKEKPQRGKILAVGPGARDEDGDYIKMDVEVGDEIIFSKYGGTEIKVGTDDVLILRESDVLAKVPSTGSKKSKKKELAGASA